MGYRKAHSDLRFIREFRNTTLAFLAADMQMRDHGHETVTNEYVATRQKYVKAIEQATQIADEYGVPSLFRLSPPPAIGGYVHTTPIYQSVIEELPWGATIPPQRLIDAIDQTEGACERQVAIEIRRLYNPFHWLLVLLTFVLRIPFLLIKTSGFHVEKFEEQLWGRLFKLLELAVLIGLLIPELCVRSASRAVVPFG
jgi:hypothetical protein